MVRAIKEHTVIRPGGLIEIRRSDLPEGATAEIIIMLETLDSPPPLTSLIGKAHSGFKTGEEADAFLRSERDAWDR